MFAISRQAWVDAFLVGLAVAIAAAAVSGIVALFRFFRRLDRARIAELEETAYRAERVEHRQNHVIRWARVVGRHIGISFPLDDGDDDPDHWHDDEWDAPPPRRREPPADDYRPPPRSDARGLRLALVFLFALFAVGTLRVAFGDGTLTTAGAVQSTTTAVEQPVTRGAVPTEPEEKPVRTFAAQLIADDTFNVAVIIACVLFIIAAVMAVLEKAYPFALVAAGLAVFALAWVVVS